MAEKKEHIHCKICQRVIQSGFRYECIGICQECVINEGVKSFKEKKIIGLPKL